MNVLTAVHVLIPEKSATAEKKKRREPPEWAPKALKIVNNGLSETDFIISED
jgi:hypothetical protein